MTIRDKPTPGPYGDSECDGCIMNDGPLHGGAYVDCCAFLWPQPYLHMHECPMSAYEPKEKEMSDKLKPCPCCGNMHLETTANVNESNNLGRCGAVWCECGLHMSARSLEEAMARWNARAAVNDEQFAMAVHNGEAWQAVRECRNVGEETGDDFKCSLCGASYNESDDMAMPASLIDWCFSCGAKVVV